MSAKKPLVAKRVSLAINCGVDLYVGQRVNWFREFMQTKNWIVFDNIHGWFKRQNTGQRPVSVRKNEGPPRLNCAQHAAELKPHLVCRNSVGSTGLLSRLSFGVNNGL